ncbi:mitochondrial intermediate peptidase [Parasteatoda tepidariorum]|uniref:mitochondrial intermediate peptidase n=1 Tax=Parasteatoda tepidariorum TaxID=114398 RepID=UPI00077FCA28|nr:mitochondrial intermediate peptidase [Parasteatoda tepidariorum]
MRINKNLNMFLNSSWLKPYYFNKHLTTWSSVASAFNTRPNRVKSLKSQFLGENTGLFKHSELQEPNGFYLLKDNAISKSEVMIQEILGTTRKRKMVTVFDELSDTLCKVADLAEFVRIGHPQERFAYAAKETSISISNLVEELNTNRDLYLKLKQVVEKGDVCATDDTDNYIANLFLFDFEQSGIHLDKKTREKIVQFNDYILHVGSHFMSRTLNPRTVLKSQLPESIRHSFSGDGDTVVVGDLFSDSKNEFLREAAYKIFLYPEKQQEELLEELLKARQKLAVLCGFPTYAHRAVRGSIAGTPEFVHEFLKLTNEKIKTNANEDYNHLLKLKQECSQKSQALMPWDVPYLIAQSKYNEFDMNISDYSPYFSLGACMDGLNYIFNALYNVTLQVEDVKDGEIWHDDVRKLSVVEGNEILGYIYCDFFERPKKPNQDCHFTIQGGRLCSDDTYQKPIVVLMLNLPNPSLFQPSLLSHCMVDNLFHEMGHAMHSMLARTTYQHVTGTRCSTDLAEVPSVLMEYFASDPRVVSKFARHYKTGETIPLNLVNKLQSCKKMFSACEMQLQVFYAAFDQACHSDNFAVFGSTTELLAHIQSIFYGLPHVPNTAWHLRFGHLVGYGAKYYSYLMSRAVASWTWYQYFKDNPFNGEEGKRYRSELLAHGGSKPPRQLVEQFLGAKVTPETLSDALLKDINTKCN